MAILSLNQAKKIDEILDYFAIQFNTKNNEILESDVVANELNLDVDEVDHLFKIMLYGIEYEGAPVVGKFNNTESLIRFTYNTRLFIDAGGTQRWFNQQHEQQKKEEKLKELEQLNLENAIKQFEVSQEEYKRTRKESKYFKWTAIISAVVAVTTLLLQLFEII